MHLLFLRMNQKSLMIAKYKIGTNRNSGSSLDIFNAGIILIQQWDINYTIFAKFIVFIFLLKWITCCDTAYLDHQSFLSLSSHLLARFSGLFLNTGRRVCSSSSGSLLLNSFRHLNFFDLVFASSLVNSGLLDSFPSL